MTRRAEKSKSGPGFDPTNVSFAWGDYEVWAKFPGRDIFRKIGTVISKELAASLLRNSGAISGYVTADQGLVSTWNLSEDMEIER